MFRSGILITAAVAALAATPALAQSHGNGHGGGMGHGASMGGMGHMGGPPMTPPGRMEGITDRSAYARDNIASQRGQFGRDFAATRGNAIAQQRKAEALAQARAVRAGKPVAATTEQVRDALAQDMEAFRAQQRLGRSEWQALRNQWMADRKTLTRDEWVARRAAWFASRDAWIANQRNYAQARTSGY